MSDLVDKEISKMHDKYYALIRYARHVPQNCRHSVKAYPNSYPKKLPQYTLKEIFEYESAYPEETLALKEDKTNFEHGFNSGCLAMIRWLGSAQQKIDPENTLKVLEWVESTGGNIEEWLDMSVEDRIVYAMEHKAPYMLFDVAICKEYDRISQANRDFPELYT